MLKNVFLVIGISALVLSCQNERKEGTDKVNASDVSVSSSASGDTKGNLPDMVFDEAEHDFGRITQGEKVSYAFKFKNTGKSNLIISSAAGSCGCTVPEWPREPILPGGEGKVNVVFSSEGKAGLQEKTITVVTNCEPSTKVVRIKANIIVPEKVSEQ
jgi:hypothetical protein